MDEFLRWVPIGISAAALWVGVVNWRRTSRLDRWQHAGSVTVYETWVLGEINAENHPEVVVRNDGNTTVQLLNFGLAYGGWWVTDRHRPETWAVLPLPLHGSIRPGEELRCPAPDPISFYDRSFPFSDLGPVATIEDVNARRWVITRVDRRPAPSPHRPPRRRDAWFERQSWWERWDERLTTRAMRAVEKSPGRWHPVPMLIDWVWGWRPGSEKPTMGPLKQPRAWRYANGAEWRVPRIDTVPHYTWRDGLPAVPTPPPPPPTK